MNRLGVLCVIGVGYVVTLAVGFLRGSPSQSSIPCSAVMEEILTLLSAPVLVVLMAAVHAYAPRELQIHGVVAVAFVGLLAGLNEQRPFCGTHRCWPSTAGTLNLAFDGIRARVAHVRLFLGSFAALRGTRLKTK